MRALAESEADTFGGGCVAIYGLAVALDEALNGAFLAFTEDVEMNPELHQTVVKRGEPPSSQRVCLGLAGLALLRSKGKPSS